MESSLLQRRRAWVTACLLTTLSLAAGPAGGAPAPGPVSSGAGNGGKYPVVVHRLRVPVEGRFTYSDDFGDPRSTDRTHQGNDLMVAKMRPLLAAADARVRRVKVDDRTSSEGNMLVLQDEDGWQYWYLHINNDTPGTDDGANPLGAAFAPGIEVGAQVKAGQVVAYAGDSGNAENTGAHLHFELHQPDGTAVDPYPSLRIAQGFRYGDWCAFDANPKRSPDPESGSGYWVVGPDGGVFAFGDAGFFGSTGNLKLNRPIVGMASSPTGLGYWLVSSDGGVFAFGDAAFFGSTGNLKLNRPIVGMAASPTGLGYWLVGSDGGVFAFGDAPFSGSTGGMALNRPIVGLAATATSTTTGSGYWMVASDGGLFAFGTAGYFGSTGGIPLAQPIVGLAASPVVTIPTPVTLPPEPTTTSTPWRRRSAVPPPAVTTRGGSGYWLLGADGGLFSFGDAGYFGSVPGTGVCKPPKATRLAPTSTGRGYWIAAEDGSIAAFGDAPDLGSPKAEGLAVAPVALVAVPPGSARSG